MALLYCGLGRDLVAHRVLSSHESPRQEHQCGDALECDQRDTNQVHGGIAWLQGSVVITVSACACMCLHICIHNHTYTCLFTCIHDPV